jgi:hypothetical protein
MKPGILGGRRKLGGASGVTDRDLDSIATRFFVLGAYALVEKEGGDASSRDEVVEAS